MNHRHRSFFFGITVAVPLCVALLICGAAICGASCGTPGSNEIPRAGNTARMKSAPRGRGTVARSGKPESGRMISARAGTGPLPAVARNAGGEAADAQTASAQTASAQTAAGHLSDGRESALPDLERIVEIERSGLYFPGLALTESALREKAGNYTGAALAAYKELSRAYSYGTAAGEQVEEGLRNAIALVTDAFHVPDTERNSAIAALEGCLAFAREDWNRAEEFLSRILIPDEEPDSFLRWMLLVCALEKEGGGSRDASVSARSAYGAIRARYALFPEYWYRGARAFSARIFSGEKDSAAGAGAAAGGNIAAAFAEQCINTGPKGPFAGECRRILSQHFGLSSGEKVYLTIRTKTEIEEVIRGSVSENNPLLLEDLFPLLALPENPYTLYAVGALKALSSVPEFKTFFTGGILKSKGRLAERLNYISRG